MAGLESAAVDHQICRGGFGGLDVVVNNAGIFAAILTLESRSKRSMAS
ncbi:MAG: hypothetical protein ACP5QO_03720 [Clostridia bacterium]